MPCSQGKIVVNIPPIIKLDTSQDIACTEWYQQ